MRILWLNATVLVPLDKGGKLRTWHLLRHLAQRHELTYLCFADPETPPSSYAPMSQVCARLETVPRRPIAKGTARFYAEAIRRVSDPRPYAVASYRSSAYARRVRELLAEAAFDLVVCDFLVPVINLPRTLPCPAVLFTHNVEAEIWRRHAETAEGRLWRWLMRTQWRRMASFERRAVGRFDLVLAVSDEDRRMLAARYGDGSAHGIRVVPTGVDTEYFTPADVRPIPGRLVFTGSMDWIPNEDAMLHFCRDVLPLLRGMVPGVTLSIVGRAPSAAVKRLGLLPGVTVTGDVPDVRPFVHEAEAVIVPLRIAGGTRLKIYEAMAMGKAIVSTTIGAEGLTVASGRDLVIADAPHAFARAVAQVLRQPHRRRGLECEARSAAVRHDWSAAAAELEAALVWAKGARAGVVTAGGIGAEAHAGT